MSATRDWRPPSTPELLAALEPALERHFTAHRRIVGLKRGPFVNRSSYAMEVLSVTLADGTLLDLLFKDVCRNSLTQTAQQAKPLFLFDPLRESLTYQRMLPSLGLGTAVCYGTVDDAAAGRSWLFLEKVSGMELYQIGDFSVWQQTARWLAALHSAFPSRELLEEATQGVPLLRCHSAYYRCWLDRALEFMLPNLSSPAAARGLEQLAHHYDHVIEFLAALPPTFLHGELYASNVLIQEAPSGHRICPVDWELAAIGPGLFDLAALVAGKWTEEEKTSLAMAYLGALPPSPKRPSAGELSRALDFCRLQVAVQWLGWSAEWHPPAEHAQDWLSEALTLATRLGL
jgi:hypothetical protein